MADAVDWTKAERPIVMVSGCYDLLHTGHVAFFEEASKFGKLYVSVGNDANIEDLKHHKARVVRHASSETWLTPLP